MKLCDVILTEDFLKKEYLENGNSIQTIADKVGCSYSYVQVHFVKFNIPRKPFKSYKGPTKTYKCIVCGKERVVPIHYAAKKFCSLECSFKSRKGEKKSRAYRRKLSKIKTKPKAVFPYKHFQKIESILERLSKDFTIIPITRKVPDGILIDWENKKIYAMELDCFSEVTVERRYEETNSKRYYDGLYYFSNGNTEKPIILKWLRA